MKKKVFLLIFAFILSGCASISSEWYGLTDSDATIKNWKYAREFQAQGRYELAKQYYLLALTTASSREAVDRLERDLYGVDLQIRTMR